MADVRNSDAEVTLRPLNKWL